MKIEDKVNYAGWIKDFVKKVIKKAEVECCEVIINDIEVGRRIYLKVDGKEYVIRTWNFVPTLKDENKLWVSYTLYVCGEDIASGRILISFSGVK